MKNLNVDQDAQARTLFRISFTKDERQYMYITYKHNSENFVVYHLFIVDAYYLANSVFCLTLAVSYISTLCIRKKPRRERICLSACTKKQVCKSVGYQRILVILFFRQ